VLKWGSVGLAAWEAYRIYQQVKRESRKPGTSAAASGDADMSPP
jgi:hypothetical protein